MDTSFSLPANPAAVAGTASVAPSFQGVTTGAFAGEFNIFDMLMQQLMVPEGQTDFAQTALTAPLMEGVIPEFGMSMEIPVALSIDEDGMLDAEQAMQLLAQWNFQIQEGQQIPSIVEEIRNALQASIDAGETGFDISQIFASATQTDIQELLQFAQENPSQETTQFLAGIQNYFGTSGSEATLASDGQTPVYQAINEEIRSFVLDQKPAQPEGTPAAVQQSSVTAEEMSPKTTFVNETAQNTIFGPAIPMPYETNQTTAANALVPEFVGESASTMSGEVEQLMQKVAEPIMTKQVITERMTARDDQAMLDAVTLESDASGDMGAMDMRSSLNLADSSLSDDAAHKGDDAVVSTESTKAQFDQKLQKLQESQDVIKQITKQVNLHQGMRSTEVTVKLHPEHLGEVRVSVKMDNDSLHANIVVANDVVKSMLESNMSGLKNALMDAGSDINKVNVMVAAEAGADESFIDNSEYGKNLQGQERQSGHGADDSSFQDFLAGNASASHEALVPERESVASKMYRVNYLA